MVSILRFRSRSLLAVLAVHALLAVYFAPPSVLFRAVPVLQDAFGAYAYHMDRAVKALQAGFGLAVYDPQLLAGRVSGAVGAFGSPIFILAGWLGHRTGSDPGRFFNAVVLLSHWAVPLFGWLSARTLSLTRGAAVLCAALFSALWYFDSLIHWSWYAGRLPWALGSYTVALTLALGHAAVKRGGIGHYVGFGASAVLVALAHPLLSGVALSLLAAFALAELGKKSSRALPVLVSWLCGLAVIVTWCGIASGMLADEPVGRIFSSTPSQLLGDLLDVRTHGSGEMGAVRAMIRVLCLVGAVIGMKRWGREDSRSHLLGSFIVGAAVFGYFGGYAPVEWAIDPYVWLVPASFLAALPAAHILSLALSPDALRRMEPRARVLLCIAAVATAPRMLRTVLWFVPAALPARVVRSPLDDRVSAFVGLNEALPALRRHDPLPSGFFEVARFFRATDPRGRVLVFDRSLAAFLSGTTRLPVMGPLSERGAPYAGSDPSGIAPSGDDLFRYMDRYGVEWILVAGDPMPFETRAEAFHPPATVAGFRCYRFRRIANDVASGVARVSSTTLGRIEVTGARGDEVVLRYHFDPALRCRPGCRVDRKELPGDAAGFLRVMHPPADFEIYDFRAPD